MIKVKIKKDTENWQKLRRNISQLSGAKVKTGWWGKTHSSGNPVAQIAKWGEEGHFTGGRGYSPPRPFITVGWVGALAALKAGGVKDVITKVASGDSGASTALQTLSEASINIMKTQIKEWNSPPNSPITIALKGFNDPLVETGELMDSVEGRVEMNGK